MDLVHEFTVPASPDRAWAALTDIPEMAACLPGAALDAGSADPYTGAVTVKMGAVTIRFRGEAEVTALDNADRRMTLDLRGKDVRGASSAAATIAMRATANGAGSTGVQVTTSLELRGKVAQFGRGVMQDVSNAILQAFVRNLEARLSTTAATTNGTSAATPTGEPATPTGRPAEDTPGPADGATGRSSGGDDVLDLGGAALPVLARRYGTTVLAGAALLTAVVALARTFRRRRPGTCTPPHH